MMNRIRFPKLACLALFGTVAFPAMTALLIRRDRLGWALVAATAAGLSWFETIRRVRQWSARRIDAYTAYKAAGIQRPRLTGQAALATGLLTVDALMLLGAAVFVVAPTLGDDVVALLLGEVVLLILLGAAAALIVGAVRLTRYGGLVPWWRISSAALVLLAAASIRASVASPEIADTAFVTAVLAYFVILRLLLRADLLVASAKSRSRGRLVADEDPAAQYR